MTGEKRSSDLSSRLSVKRGGKLISKTLSKASSPPSISAPPKAAVGTPKVKKDEVQRRKNSFHDMFKGSTKDKDGDQAVLLNVPAEDAPSPSPSHRSRGNVTSRAATARITADDSQFLKHKEPPNSESDRLAEAKVELALAKDEIATLRQELERVKQEAQASVDISKYQAAEAHQKTIAEDPSGSRPHDYPNSNDDANDALVNQNYELRCRLTELEDQLLAQSTPQPSENLHNDEDWDALTLRLHEAEKESHSRLQQLLSLKSSISSLTRADSQASDSELADSFSQLANRVREWVVSNYRRTKMNFNDLPSTAVQMLQSIKGDYQDIDGADKLALYQAIVSRMLMHIFEEPLVVGMPDQDIFVGLRAFFNGTQHADAESLEWRRATLRVIERSVHAATVRDWRQRRLEILAFELEAIMRSISSTELSSSARSVLIGIMTSAAELQQTLCLQKAEYGVVFFGTPHDQHHHFDDHTMEPVNDLEYTMEEGGGPNRQREFVFCVFPCLEKYDNGIENIILRARVCCGVG
ncbi:hypothetical protein OPT61_g1101 [Boeremia exigua]|uniref:Uncharacterized protein n=1 Tax=Boeremia exigua TaxID=749465 RepID=A0ACC2IRJ9_9PLEO|nr:hypothetical protein OPT61_g1101 [Boeremia exigua]